MKNTFSRNLLFAAFLFLNSGIFAQDPNFYLYLCFGQSNMEGQGTIEAQDRTVNSRFRVMEAVDCTNLGRTKGKWYTAVPPLCRCYSGLSPIDYFSRTLVSNLPDSIKIGVINVSVAGCKIELFDKNNYQAYATTVESWMKNIITEYGGNPYGRLVEMAKLAQKSGVIRGILLHQGESNTGDTQWPAKVKAIYNNLIQDLTLKPDSVPLLAGEVVGADQGGLCASMNSIIAKLPQTLPNAFVISSKGCTDASDNIHFNSAGYRELGKRYALKMLSLMGVQVTSTVEFPGNDPAAYLEQNHPNPSSGKTEISFNIPCPSFVSLKVFNLQGVEMAELAGKYFPEGRNTLSFDGAGFPEGIYLYSLTTGKSTLTKKMIIRRK